MKKLCLLVLVLLCGGPVVAQNGADTLRIYYRAGQSVVEPALCGNGTALDAFIGRLKSVCADPCYGNVQLELRAHASLEGSSAQNEALGNQRVELLLATLRQAVPLPDRAVSLAKGGYDWEGLTRLVETSDMPYRDDVLAILRNTPEWVHDAQGRLVDSRKRQLGMLRSGIPYRYMAERFFPSMRNAFVRISYTYTPASADSLPGTVFATGNACDPIVVRDTVIIRDTIVVHDTVYVCGRGRFAAKGQIPPPGAARFI